MSLGICIPDLIAQGKVAPERAKQVQDRYDYLVRQFESEGHARASAEAMATDKALKMFERDTALKKRDALLQASAQLSWLDRAKMAAGESGVLSPRLAHDRMVALDKKIDVVRGRYFATLDGLLAKFRRDVFGRLRNKSDLENVGRVLFGETVDDLNANELGSAMKSVMDIARQRRNAAGGHIGKLEDYGLPQRHDWRAVRAVPFDQWRAHPAIERVKVVDVETGDFASGLRRDDILRAVYETIRSDGADKAKPGQMFGGSLANRRSDPRVLHFEGYDDWIDYQKSYGGNDNVYDIFVSHIGQMARETAIMEELGPNPLATIRFQQDWLDKSARSATGGDTKAIDRIEGGKKQLQRLYDEITGANKIPENRRLALTFSAVVAQQVAAKLGSGVLSAVSDVATLTFNAGFNKTPIMGTLGRYVKLWNPLDDGDRRLAVRLGLVTDDWLALSSSSQRYTGEELTGEISRRMADFVIRSQGLARHTRNGQWAFGMEFAAHLTEMRDRSFGNLDPALQRQMGRYDISEADWDRYRATPVRQERGSDWIFPTDAEPKAADKIMEMILTETDYAIIMPDLRTRALKNRFGSGNPAGTLLSSALLFKSFPIAFINLHGRRMFEQAGAYNKAVYGLTLLGMMTAGGALSVQLKSLASGKDPQPMDDDKFWAKALMQSGGLGVFGDLLYNSENSFGGGPLQTLAGPLLGQTLPNAFDATAGNVKRAVDGDAKSKPEFGKDIANVALAEVPFSNMWYTRQLYQFLFAQMIRNWTDPDAAQANARMVKRAEEEGTQYFIPPGSFGQGARLPDFGNALGDGGNSSDSFSDN